MIAGLFKLPTLKTHMVSSSYPNKTMIEITDATLILNMPVYDTNDIVTFVRASTLSESTKKTICNIVMDEEHYRTYSPDKFDVHFTNKKMTSLFHISNSSVSQEKCLAVIIE